MNRYYYYQLVQVVSGYYVKQLRSGQDTTHAEQESPISNNPPDRDNHR